MKKNSSVIIIFFLVLLSSCGSDNAKYACFHYFEYSGKDTLFGVEINPGKEFFNPILCGFYPDPSICRKGDDFFLVNSSFSFYPGIPIFTGKDLVNWTQIGNVLNRPSQLNLDGIRISGGIYAPAIEYNKHNDTFYLITTCVDGIGNFVVKTRNPYEGWSDPIRLPQVGGIDPSLFFDDDGKAYIVNNDAPEGVPEWEGHRAIWIHQYDVKNDRTFGSPRVVVDGGTDKSQRPVWIEGPHLYKRNGKYLLICAEGGTGTNHSQVAFSSNNIFGPYIPFEQNPILTQRDLPENRKDKITSVGHADLIEDTDGKTWAVFLGCRPYMGNYYNTGRETFLLPVQWEEDCPVILKHNLPLPLIVEKQHIPRDENFLTGNFTWKDEFNTNRLDDRWLMIRTPRTTWYKLENNQLKLQALPVGIEEKQQPAFLGHRQQHTNFKVITEFEFTPENENEIAGLVCYQNEEYHIIFGKTILDGKPVLIIERTEKESKRMAVLEIENTFHHEPIKLKIEGNGRNYSFFAAFGENDWQPVANNVDARNLSTEKAGGFVGTLIGPYVSSTNKSDTSNPV
jgi:Beta-xylosidase